MGWCQRFDPWPSWDVLIVHQRHNSQQATATSISLAQGIWRERFTTPDHCVGFADIKILSSPDFTICCVDKDMKDFFFCLFLMCQNSMDQTKVVQVRLCIYLCLQSMEKWVVDLPLSTHGGLTTKSALENKQKMVYYLVPLQALLTVSRVHKFQSNGFVDWVLPQTGLVTYSLYFFRWICGFQQFV